MDFDTIIAHLSALGFDVKNGYIIKDKYRFGRLNKNVIVPEDDVSPENNMLTSNQSTNLILDVVGSISPSLPSLWSVQVSPCSGTETSNTPFGASLSFFN